MGFWIGNFGVSYLLSHQPILSWLCIMPTELEILSCLVLVMSHQLDNCTVSATRKLYRSDEDLVWWTLLIKHKKGHQDFLLTLGMTIEWRRNSASATGRHKQTPLWVLMYFGCDHGMGTGAAQVRLPGTNLRDQHGGVPLSTHPLYFYLMHWWTCPLPYHCSSPSFCKTSWSEFIISLLWIGLWEFMTAFCFGIFHYLVHTPTLIYYSALSLHSA